jgi:zinc protease
MRPLFLLALLLAATTGLSAAAPRFAHDASDLPADPAVKFGRLPNGFRYAVLANREPRERAALRLLVEVGSLHETEQQLGIAHFLEHMAFNGSTHYAPGTLIEFFQKMGMNFGGDTNAFTSFDRTVYMIDLPNTQPATLAEGFQVIHDYASGLLLLESEIDRERGVILSEKRTRDSVDYRSFVAEFEFALRGSRLTKRLPIGTEEIIRSAPRDAFVDFYNTWYRPERMALVVVGDFDAAAIEQEIMRRYADLAPRDGAREDPERGPLAPREGVDVLYHHEPEAGATTVGIQIVQTYQKEQDTAATRLSKLPRNLALAMLNRRLSELAKKEGAPFSRGQAVATEHYDFVRNAGIELTCQPHQWADALAVADQELRRALEHGFQAAELREATAEVRNALEQAVRRAPTRRSPELAMELISAIADDEVFTTPAHDLALFGPVLEQVTLDDCVRALREAWSAPHRLVSVIGNANLREGNSGKTAAASTSPASGNASPEGKIRQVFETSRIVAVAPPAAIEETEFAYTDFGPPGEVRERRHVPDLDITQVVFANGVRLNLKQTDFEAGRIAVSVRVGTGQLTESRETPGLATFANNTFIQGGLGQHSADDLRRILAGKNVGVGFRVDSDAFVFAGGTTPDDLLLQLQLTAAHMTDPGYRPEAARQIMKAIAQYYAQLAHVPQGPLQLEVPRLLASGDPRFGLPPQADLERRTLEEVKSWLTPQLAEGAVEVALAGDLEVDAAIDAVARTLGALPPRRQKPLLEELRQVSFPPPFNKDYTVPTEIPKGVVALYWPTTDSRNVHIARRLNLLAEVLSDRLRVKIREEIGGAYSPSAGSTSSDTYRNYGYINAYIVVEPEKAAEIAQVTRELAADLAANGVTADELERAKQPILTALRESARTNGYWMGAVLGSAQEFPQRLDWARSRYSDIESVTKSELDELAQRYLGDERAFQVVVLPAHPGESAQPPPGPTAP